MILFFLFFSFGECPVFDLIPVGATEITSPSYPGVYPDMLNCTWTIYSSSGNKLKAVIKDFVTEDARDCVWDCLSIYDGPHLSSRLLGRLNSSLFVALLFWSLLFNVTVPSVCKVRERGASTVWLGIWSRSLYSWVKLVSGLPRAIESSSVIQGLLGISSLDSVLIDFHFQCHGYVGWYYIGSLYKAFFL